MANDGGVWTKIYPDVASLGGGKVLQVVRAVNRSSLTTASTSWTDAGVSVTITPTTATSHLMIVFTGLFTGGSDERDHIQITDTNDVPVDGINGVEIRGWASSRSAGYYQLTAIGYASPATTSPVTYKMRWKVGAGTVYLQGGMNTTQLYAIELEDVVVSP